MIPNPNNTFTLEAMTTVRLNCGPCQRRKTKCNKQFPCSACTSIGIRCEVVERERLPRGKSGRVARKNVVLAERLSRLEQLLQQHGPLSRGMNISAGLPEPAQRPPLTPESSSRAVNSSTASDSPSHQPRLDRYIAPDFWTSLSEQVSGLRESLQALPEDEDLALHDTPCAIVTGLPFRQPEGPGGLHHLPVPTESLRSGLLDLYSSRVDSVYRMWHWPATLSLLNNNKPHNQQDPAIQALEYAIYFMALCSVTDAECEIMTSVNRLDLLRDYRLATETLLSRAGLSHRPDLTVLNAFVVYLLALRTCLNSASTWMLLSLAVRTATALRLGKEDKQNFSAYDLQLRRRLWYFIGLLDTHAALDRGTPPLLSADEMGPAPLNILDIDMTSGVIPSASVEAFTEMSFSSMVYEAMMCQKRMCDGPAKDESAKDEWERRVKLVNDFETSMRRKYYGISDQATPIEQITKLASREIVTNMQILLRRPPYLTRNSFTPQEDDFPILGVATEVLRRSLSLKVPKFSQWAWKSWVKWYVLAVVLAELCADPASAVFDEGYDVAQQSYEHHRQAIADGEKGMLWRPIVRLMRRATQLKQMRIPQMLSNETPYPTDTDNGQLYWSLDRATQCMAVETPLAFESLDLEISRSSGWLGWNSFLGQASFSEDGNCWGI